MRGIGVSPGMAIGAAVVVQTQLPDVPHRVVPRSQVEREVRRLRAAVKDVQRHVADLKARTTSGSANPNTSATAGTTAPSPRCSKGLRSAPTTCVPAAQPARSAHQRSATCPRL